MLTDKDKDRLTTIYNAAADIQRWALSSVIADRLSEDRRKDIQNHCKLISNRAWSIGKSTQDT